MLQTDLATTACRRHKIANNYYIENHLKRNTTYLFLCRYFATALWQDLLSDFRELGIIPSVLPEIEIYSVYLSDTCKINVIQNY